MRRDNGNVVRCKVTYSKEQCVDWKNFNNMENKVTQVISK